MPRVAASRGREFERYSVYNFAGGLDLRTNPRVRAIQKGQNTLSQANECLNTSSGAVARRLRSQRVETHVGSVGPGGGAWGLNEGKGRWVRWEFREEGTIAQPME